MKVAGYNLGCKVNKYELDAILSDFEKENFEIVDFDEFADVYIISTCAVTALAEKVAGSESEFVRLMNETASSFGCKNTHFVNPTGLHDENHVSRCSFADS